MSLVFANGCHNLMRKSMSFNNVATAYVKGKYGKSRYRNMSEKKKKRLKEYQKNYSKSKKSQYNNE